MKFEKGQYSLYGNLLSKSESRKIQNRQERFYKKFDYDPAEKYTLSTKDNPYLGPLFGVKDIVRGEVGEEINLENAVICSTIRMGFGHYRIAMAGVSCARAMGFTPYWLDLLAIPGVTTRVINWCNTNYSRFSRISQQSQFFNKHVWEAVTTGEPTIPGISTLLRNWIEAWPWRFLKTNVKDYTMSELFKNLHEALPSNTPILTAHMWNCMGAVAGGMTNVVDMMFDNWPMAFQLTEGAKHAVQSPSGYYGFRTLNRFTEDHKVLNPMPADAIYYTGAHVDHEIVENIEIDCKARLERMKNKQPRRFLLTMGGTGAQKELFKAVIEHAIPLIKKDQLTLFVNLGDHKENWIWLKEQIVQHLDLVTTHFSWDDTREFTDQIRSNPVSGLHIFLYDNIFHAVYATNYLMRVIDIMITKPSELAFYPVPKIFNERVGGHEMWGAIRSAELGDGTIETRTVPHTLQAIDLLTHEDDLLTLYCEQIIKNKSIGIYDGGYKSVELATGKKFIRSRRESEGR